MCSAKNFLVFIHMHMNVQAYKRGYWYPRYHFILFGWYSQEWWKATASECTAAHLELTLQHSLTVDALPDAQLLGDEWKATDLGIVSVICRSVYNKRALFAIGIYEKG